MGGVGIFGFLIHEAVIGYRLGRDTHEIFTFSINTDSQRGFAVSVLIYFIIFLTKQLREGVFKGSTDDITEYEGLSGSETYIIQ